MPKITVYHNPNFLDYRGNHSQIVLSTQPVATVTVPAGLTLDEMLGAAYARTQHGYEYPSWFNDPDVIPHLRSTSVGDVLEACTESRSPERSRRGSRSDEQGNLFVVESMGFRPYQPRAIHPYHRLTEAFRLLDQALMQANVDQVSVVANRVRNIVRHVLEMEGYPNGEVPILSWANAQPGDLVGSPDAGLFRVIARKLRPKWRAKRLLAHIPDAQIWIDSPRTWAVLVPVPVSETTSS